MKVAIIGAGAAGCFCAVNLKRRMPGAEVRLFEKGTKPLAKVALTGGGRCNLTNSFRDVRSLEQVYPRGARLMKRALGTFSHEDTRRWFEAEGVRLIVQEDQCVFPASQDAGEIVRTLMRLADRLGIRLATGCRIADIRPLMEEYDRVVVATGGSPARAVPAFLDPLGLETVSPVPSLFTFNVADEALRGLMGTVVEEASCRLCGTRFQASGPLLVTHWGLSGPAILRLSAHGARWLAGRGYSADVGIGWMGARPAQEVRGLLQELRAAHPQKQLSSVYPRQLNQRLWSYLLAKAGLSPAKRWAETGERQLNRLAEVLAADTLRISGRGTFKEEFVTCGGVALSEIDLRTLEAKRFPGLHFAGEVLDVDAVTGGFNLQAAWSTGYAVARHIAENN